MIAQWEAESDTGKKHSPESDNDYEKEDALKSTD